MSEMTYKQAIKILSETKVADLPYNGAKNNHKMYDIARRMAIQALQEKAAEEEPISKQMPDVDQLPCSVGDIIPFKVKTGYVISYIVEKIKVDENGVMKIRCRHGGGGQARSFLASEARRLIQTGGNLY